MEFRLWDEEQRIMIYPRPEDAVVFINGECSLWKDPQYDDNKGSIYCRQYNRLIPMLFTGVTDVNGQKIYEKDILTNSYNSIFVVELVRGAFYLKIRHISNGGESKEIKWLEWLPLGEITRTLILKNFQKIGNTYENPELFKGEQDYDKVSKG